MKHPKLGTPYAKDQKHRLAGVKARQERLGDTYRVSNKIQMRRNRRKRRDKGQTMLPLITGTFQNSAPASNATPPPAGNCAPDGYSPPQQGQPRKSKGTKTP